MLEYLCPPYRDNTVEAMHLSCGSAHASLRRGACSRRRQAHAAAAAHAPQTPPAPQSGVPRRAALLLPAVLACAPPTAHAAEASPLWERLEQRQLSKPVFNLPPAIQVYPDWLLGTWDVDTKFAGYAFPSTTIDKACVSRPRRLRPLKRA